MVLAPKKLLIIKGEGLTATLVREDGKEEEVFSLIGPKKVDVPWSSLMSNPTMKSWCPVLRLGKLAGN